MDGALQLVLLRDLGLRLRRLHRRRDIHAARPKVRVAVQRWPHVQRCTIPALPLHHHHAVDHMVRASLPPLHPRGTPSGIPSELSLRNPQLRMDAPGTRPRLRLARPAASLLQPSATHPCPPSHCTLDSRRRPSDHRNHHRQRGCDEQRQADHRQPQFDQHLGTSR